MKNLVILIALLVSTTTFATATRTIVFCGTDDGAIRLVIKENAEGALRAFVTVEATGGGYPVFSYPVEHVPTPQGIYGAGDRYRGNSFELAVNTDSPPTKLGIDGSLSIDSLSVLNQQVFCQYSQ